MHTAATCTVVYYSDEPFGICTVKITWLKIILAVLQNKDIAKLTVHCLLVNKLVTKYYTIGCW